MSTIHDSQKPKFGLQSAWQGVIVAPEPTDLQDQVYIKIPDLDPDLRLGPCKWQSRDTVSLPGQGDECLVIFDNDRQPWVVAWWPF